MLLAASPVRRAEIVASHGTLGSASGVMRLIVRNEFANCSSRARGPKWLKNERIYGRALTPIELAALASDVPPPP